MSQPSAQRVVARWFRRAGWDNLKPNERVKVYHGTRMRWIPELINGFDANKTTKRDYQTRGYRHAGLFVSPSERTARSFGPIVLEIEIAAKHMHGTDYSGKIRRKRGPEWDWQKEDDAEKFPDSFRPGLSETMLQTTEPQAILRGLVKPAQIKRVQYDGKWYSRKDFLALDLEVHNPGKPVRDIGYDLSNPSYTLDQFVAAMAASMRMDVSRIESTLMIRSTLPPARAERSLKDLIDRAGFGPTATKAFLRLLLERAIEDGPR